MKRVVRWVLFAITIPGLPFIWLVGWSMGESESFWEFAGEFAASLELLP